MISSMFSFSVSSRNAPPHKVGGALRDDTKNGCVADYMCYGTFRIFSWQTPRTKKAHNKNFEKKRSTK